MISFTARQDRLYSKKRIKFKTEYATGTELSDKNKELCNSLMSRNVLRLSTVYCFVCLCQESTVNKFQSTNSTSDHQAIKGLKSLRFTLLPFSVSTRHI